MRVLNASQMREADRRTIEEIGVPSVVLMENAGRQVVAALETHYAELADWHVALLCGRGNNGGDGFVVARVLQQRGIDISVFVIGALADVRGDARVNLEILGRLGVDVVEIADGQQWELHSSEIERADLIVDALFGTGLKSPLEGMLETVVDDLNAMASPVVSVDLPSGLSSDTCELIGHAVEASLTVTLAAPKLPLVLPPARANAGEVVVADIGIPAEVLEAVEGPRVSLLTPQDMRELVQPRAPDSHKGDFGHVLVVAGSLGKTGAAYMAASAALRSGAGLVTVATPRSCLPIIASLGAEFMTQGLPDTPDGLVDPSGLEAVLSLQRDVIAVGPGLGTGAAPRAFVRGLLDSAGVPLVMDADALNVFTGEPTALVGREGRDVIITPHPGEMARLVGMSVKEVQANRLDIARNFATGHRLFVVLKGHRTLVATPAGEVYINTTGNPGMATGGTGDVLTGMIAAWLGQLLDPEAACKLAVYLHGAAGDLAEADLGEVALTAGDVLDHLGDAVLELTARRRVEPRA
jgi:hydroxyethylthiazole kinase-like uncharacterized protein yjeF